MAENEYTIKTFIVNSGVPFDVIENNEALRTLAEIVDELNIDCDSIVFIRRIERDDGTKISLNTKHAREQIKDILNQFCENHPNSLIFCSAGIGEDAIIPVAAERNAVKNALDSFMCIINCGFFCADIPGVFKKLYRHYFVYSNKYAKKIFLYYSSGFTLPEIRVEE